MKSPSFNLRSKVTLHCASQGTYHRASLPLQLSRKAYSVGDHSGIRITVCRASRTLFECFVCLFVCVMAFLIHFLIHHPTEARGAPAGRASTSSASAHARNAASYLARSITSPNSTFSRSVPGNQNNPPVQLSSTNRDGTPPLRDGRGDWNAALVRTWLCGVSRVGVQIGSLDSALSHKNGVSSSWRQAAVQAIALTWLEVRPAHAPRELVTKQFRD